MAVLTGRFPFSPFPDGWFFLCSTDELSDSTLLSRTWMGREVVVFRGADGRAAALDAICPHLGAHMGHGGCVKGGTVECPFHHFRFDAEGSCVAVPGAEPPKRARANSYPVQEVNGFVLGYYDAAGREPTWRIPELVAGPGEQWSDLTHHHYRVRSHPQETTENGVDPVHLKTIHGYSAVDELSPMAINGAHLRADYQLKRSAGPLEALGVKLEPTLSVDVWGLGYSIVVTDLAEYGFGGRMFILSTPSDGEFIDLHIALSVKQIEHPDRILPGLGRVPMAWLTPLVRSLYMLAFKNDIEQDFDIWQHKGYVETPALARNDGPIFQFRRYCRQFYPELRDMQAAEGSTAAE